MADPCACIYVDMDDPVRMLREGEVTARKNHRCMECGVRIKKGTRYWFDNYFHEETITYHKMCLDCKSLRDVFFCDGYIFTEQIERLREHIECMEGRVFCDGVADLTPGAKDKLFAMVEAYWAEDEEEDDDA